MFDMDRTTRFTDHIGHTDGQVVTIFDAACPPRTVSLSAFGKSVITFGREAGNDILLNSPLVSRNHGRFVFLGGKWRIEDCGSTNGLIYNNSNIRMKEIGDGDFIRIDDGIQTVAAGVLFVFSGSTTDKWYTLDITNTPVITIGRSPECTLVLPHVSISKNHARIVREGSRYVIYDNGSTNGVIVNGRRVIGREILNEKDIINITNSKLIFTSSMISYSYCRSGITVDASNIVIQRGKGRKSFITSNNVSLSVQPGELVAIIGGSGAGKSTILNAMCGYLKPTSGNVYINGMDLYQNIDSIKKMVGYVPQSDIVYDNLTLYDMLKYTAKLRLPKDTSPAEMENAISRAIATVELTEKKNSFIKALSGGQRKRASIAVELLSDPNLLFLDEPASGLDPGTERTLMTSLRQMANSGKTIILVTHSTLQLKLCDKIVFMGKGGNLCFYGSYDEALSFFGVSDIVDVYKLITDNAPMWRDKYAATVSSIGAPRPHATGKKKKQQKSRIAQFAVMSSRYAKLIANDRVRLLILLILPCLSFALLFVKSGNEYEDYAMTNIMLFALAIICFTIGLFSSIQEICKEKNILRREYMAGLSLTSYLMSKVAVLGIVCLFQSIVITVVSVTFIGKPEEGLFLPPVLETFVVIFLITFGATATGLFVSALFKNPDRALTVAPAFIALQLIFSGVIFGLSDEIAFMGAITLCHWGVCALGNSAKIYGLKSENLQDSYPCQFEDTEKNNLYVKLGDFLKKPSEKQMEKHMLDPDDSKLIAYTKDKNNPLRAIDWDAYTDECRVQWLITVLILIGSAIILIVLARLLLQRISREKS